MHRALNSLIELLDLEEIEANLYRGRTDDTGFVFGGHVLAQSVVAAFRTVDPSRRLHSLHGYFLRPGDSSRPILYEVDRIRDGRSFTTRRVVAIQNGAAIFNMASSWHVEEPGLEHAIPAPEVPRPEALSSDADIYAKLAEENPQISRFAERFGAIETRQVEDVPLMSETPQPPTRHTWVRIADALPDGPELHFAFLAYMSDMDFMGTAMLPHGRRHDDWGSFQGASLDHALWFHRPFRADQWLLFAKESPAAAHARGFVRGFFFDEAGHLVASAAQECLIRPRR
ncbi:MAG: acyl-CoA thioesterase II [Gammaproteobacteria bacterium]|jgi:acyl-CoA thioesterase-2